MGDVDQDYSWVRGVIFDLDGTLYSQSKLRTRMAAELLAYSLLRGPQAARILRSFRNVREELAEGRTPNASELQYRRVADRLGVSVKVVELHVEEWMYQRPLRHLARAIHPGIIDLVLALRSRNVQIAVFSDYPVVEKLNALGIVPDVSYYALQEPNGYLKPSTHGLRRVLELLGLSAEDCLFVGDRMERDGACADELGIKFLLCDKSDLFLKLAKSQWR